MRDFPRFERQGGLMGVLQFLLGVLLWFLLLLLVFFSLIANWFTNSLKYFLSLFKPKDYQIPFWFSLVFSIFLLPLVLVFNLTITLIKIIRQ
jgi:hypothetical protein